MRRERERQTGEEREGQICGSLGLHPSGLTFGLLPALTCA